MRQKCVTVRLTDKEFKALEEEARKEGISKSEYLRLFIRRVARKAAVNESDCD